MESRISWYSHPGTKSWHVLSSALKATLGKDTILLSYVRSPWKLLTLPLWPEPYTLSQIADIQVSLLKKKGKKINKQKPQFNRAGRSEQGALVPFENSRAQEEEARLLFPGKDSASEKPRTPGSLQPSQLPCPLYKWFSFLATWGCAHSSPWLQTRNCYSPPILNKPTLVEKKTWQSYICFKSTPSWPYL